MISMNESDFVVFIKNFAERAIPATTRNGRHLYIWQGTREALAQSTPRHALSLLDLYSLCKSLEQTPLNTNLARKQLEQAIQHWLAVHFPIDTQQRVLLVTGCTLLMRYHVPLGAFTRQANEHRMIIFLIPSLDSQSSPRPLPSFIHLKPDATLDYFKKQMDDALIE